MPSRPEEDNICALCTQFCDNNLCDDCCDRITDFLGLCPFCLTKIDGQDFDDDCGEYRCNCQHSDFPSVQGRRRYTFDQVYALLDN